MSRSKRRKPKPSAAFDQGKEVRAIARERLGMVKPGQVIDSPKPARKKKHKPPAGTLPEQ